VRWFWVWLNNFFNKRDNPSLHKHKGLSLNWTRANKPFNEMSKEEQLNFIYKMAETISDISPKR